MTHSMKWLAAGLVLAGAAAGAPAGAADFTFQFVNETQRTLAMKLFSRGESLRQWPSKTRAYSVKPEGGVQELKIDCDEGEQICWGAWTGALGSPGTIGGSHQREGRSTKSVAGAGDRGTQTCTDCCHACKAGGKAPVATLTEGDFAAR
jgi:hypothetical protein